VFTLDELWALDVQTLDYTFIDNMPSVVITHTAGVTLADLLAASGIDLGSVQSFNFWTNDKQGGYYTSLTKTFLIDTPRYCYYSLPDNFDYDTGRGNEYADLERELVPTMIALADDWNRALAGASFGSDYLNLNTYTRFRLVYGQTDTATRTASNSAKWVHSIEVTLGGAPTLTLDESVLELEVGSRFRSEPYVDASDPVIAENAEITWSSDNPAVAEVDENGDITVRSEGEAVITARYGDLSASVLVRGASEDADGGAGYDAPSGAELDGGASDAEPPEAGAQIESAVETGETTEPGDEKIIIGRELSILPKPKAQSEGMEGGVQNWRADEMSSEAVELPVIPAETSGGFAAVVFTFFVGGGAYKLIRFRKEL
jgi:hypothetical protein